ncbi:MAG: sugar transferase [Glaciihabitans sp.]
MIDQTTTDVAHTATGNWRRTYAKQLVASDLLVLLWVIFGVQIAWLGLDQSALGVSGSQEEIAISYTVVSSALVLGWLATLGVYGTRGYRVLGAGAQEYKLIADSSMRLFGVLAIAAFLFKIDLARGYVLIALPLGLGLLLFSRWMWRQWLGVQRRNGKYSSTVLLVGSEASATHIAKELARQPEAGYRVVGACVPSGRVADYLVATTVPVMGTVDAVLSALEATGADTVVITSSDELTPQRVRELSWSLEPGRQHLVVAPSLTGLGGPRVHTRPVSGLPLIHVETPRYDGGKTWAKRGFDLTVSIMLIVILSPLLAIVAGLVRLSGPGPVLFRQRRVGIRGTQFDMKKFRSMNNGSERALPDQDELGSAVGNTVLFKMRDDPRVTPIGRVLRRYSLDELPQLFNVLIGNMSLVGPRPPLETEVAAYETHVHRRFLVKPGMTGLWQVSGRSNLSWEDSVRLDLYYVENWSMTGDLVILWRTAMAVLRREGAY